MIDQIPVYVWLILGVLLEGGFLLWLFNRARQERHSAAPAGTRGSLPFAALAPADPSVTPIPGSMPRRAIPPRTSSAGASKRYVQPGRLVEHLCALTRDHRLSSESRVEASRALMARSSNLALASIGEVVLSPYEDPYLRCRLIGLLIQRQCSASMNLLLRALRCEDGRVSMAAETALRKKAVAWNPGAASMPGVFWPGGLPGAGQAPAGRQAPLPYMTVLRFENP